MFQMHSELTVGVQLLQNASAGAKELGFKPDETDRRIEEAIRRVRLVCEDIYAVRPDLAQRPDDASTD